MHVSRQYLNIQSLPNYDKIYFLIVFKLPFLTMTKLCQNEFFLVSKLKERFDLIPIHERSWEHYENS